MKGRLLAIVMGLAAIAVVPTTASASSNSSTGPSVAIAQQAQFISPTTVDVQVSISCQGAATVQVQVTQTAAISPATGVGDSGLVLCSQKTVAVSVNGGNFHLGKAQAAAAIIELSGAAATDQKVIDIIL